MATLTIELPETINQQVQAYGISQQDLQSLITAFVQNYLSQYQVQHSGEAPVSPPVTGPPFDPPPLPLEVEEALVKLDNLSNGDLWDIARTALNQDDLNEIERLTSQQREAGLTAAANAQLHELLSRYDQAVLKRARAIALLKQRGQDVSSH